MRKRWRIAVVAKDPVDKDSLAYAISRSWGDKPQMFWLRFNARRAAHFYEHVLGLPAHFYVVPNYSQLLERSDSQVEGEA